MILTNNGRTAAPALGIATTPRQTSDCLPTWRRVRTAVLALVAVSLCSLLVGREVIRRQDAKKLAAQRAESQRTWAEHVRERDMWFEAKRLEREREAKEFQDQIAAIHERAEADALREKQIEALQEIASARRDQTLHLELNAPIRSRDQATEDIAAELRSLNHNLELDRI